MRVGDALRFQPCDPMQAVEAAWEREARNNNLTAIIKAGRLSFTQRLWMNNLISGVVDEDIL